MPTPIEENNTPAEAKQPAGVGLPARHGSEYFCPACGASYDQCPCETNPLAKPSRLHGSHSCTKLEIKGCFGISGPQPVGVPGGAPEWVARAFADNPEIKAIAVVRENGGSVWQRIIPNASSQLPRPGTRSAGSQDSKTNLNPDDTAGRG